MLHNFLSENRSALIDLCREKRAKRSQATPKESVHGVSLFLEQLTVALRLDADVDLRPAEEDAEIGLSAGRHGNELLQRGYTISQVVHDYGDLCQSITELARQRDAPITTGEFHTFNRCLDNAIAGAVTSYAESTQAVVLNRGRQTLNARVGALAQEMRDLLHALVLAVEWVRKGDGAPDAASAALIDRNLAAMRQLVEQSLAEVRLGAGLPAVLVTQERILVDEFIGHLAFAASLEAAQRGIQFMVHPIEQGLAIHADRRMLSAAISNLLQNAFKFSRPNGHVSLKVYASNDRILFEIEDECGGWPSGAVDALFKPFQRSTDRTGLGLGLSIANRSVEANGGSLRVRDIPGAGCVFTIDLPRPHRRRKPSTIVPLHGDLQLPTALDSAA
jgi:signal transduction histidine kinase